VVGREAAGDDCEQASRQCRPSDALPVAIGMEGGFFRTSVSGDASQNVAFRAGAMVVRRLQLPSGDEPSPVFGIVFLPAFLVLCPAAQQLEAGAAVHLLLISFRRLICPSTCP
jgi:hypothetical protein